MDLPALAVAALDLMTFLEGRRRPACLIGGIVVSRWGEPRATEDVDATVLTDFGEEPAVLRELLSRYASRVPAPEEFAGVARLALIVLPGNVKADVSFAAFPFEREAIDRATFWELAPNVKLRTCSAEDLVVYKLVAARPGDIQDVISVVRRQGARLDAARVRHWGAQFADLKEDPDLLRPFEDARRKAGLSD